MPHFSDAWKKAKADFKKVTHLKKPSGSMTKAEAGETISATLKVVDAVFLKGDPTSAASSERTSEWLASFGRAHGNFQKTQLAYLRLLDQEIAKLPAGAERVAYTTGATRLKKELKALDKEMLAIIAQTTLELKQYRAEASHAALEKRKWVALFTSDLGRLSAAVAAVKANPTEANYRSVVQNFEKLSGHLLHPKLPRDFGGNRPATDVARRLSVNLPGTHFQPTPQRLAQEADAIKAQLGPVKEWLRAAAAD